MRLRQQLADTGRQIAVAGRSMQPLPSILHGREAYGRRRRSCRALQTALSNELEFEQEATRMKTEQSTAAEMVLLSHDDYVVLGESDFGTPGLTATEIIGPFVPMQASGPLIMVHDAFVEANKGIGHHPHRYNERLFYILEGSLSHDDALNGITGFMGKGDVARLTEGETGMLHKEWNDTGEPTHASSWFTKRGPSPNVHRSLPSATPMRRATRRRSGSRRRSWWDCEPAWKLTETFDSSRTAPWR